MRRRGRLKTVRRSESRDGEAKRSRIIVKKALVGDGYSLFTGKIQM